MTTDCEITVTVTPPPPVVVRVTPVPPIEVQIEEIFVGVTITPPPPVIATIISPEIRVIVSCTGQQGPPGADGSAFYYEHTQALASAGWLVQHNLGKHPNIQVFLDTGEIMVLSPQHLDLNSIYVAFSVPQTGLAVCS